MDFHSLPERFKENNDKKMILGNKRKRRLPDKM